MKTRKIKELLLTLLLITPTIAFHIPRNYAAKLKRNIMGSGSKMQSRAIIRPGHGHGHGWSNHGQNQIQQESPDDSIPGLAGSSARQFVQFALSNFNIGFEFVANGLLDTVYLGLNGADLGVQVLGAGIQQFWRFVAAIPPGDLWKFQNVYKNGNIH